MSYTIVCMSDQNENFYKLRAQLGVSPALIMGYRTCALGTPDGTAKSARLIYDQGNSVDFEFFSHEDLAVYQRWIIRDFMPLLDKIGKPWMLVNGDTNCFNHFELTKNEKSHILKKGLHIYLHEPLFITNQDGAWPWNKDHEVPNFPELNTISAWIKRNNIKSEVVIHTCEPKIAEYFKKNGLFSNIKFVPFNTFHMFFYFHSISYAFPIGTIENFERRMICLNFRYESYREILIAYLRGIDALKQSFVTFYHRHDEVEFRKRLRFDPHLLEEWKRIEDGIRSMQNEVPYTLELDRAEALSPRTQGIPSLHVQSYTKDDWKIKEYFQKSFCALICESRPSSISSEISEKTLNCIFQGRPFIIVASPGTLQNIKELGFKTFSDLWDESYDNIIDPVNRLDTILKIVRSIHEMSDAEVRELAMKAKPIIEFNRHYLQTIFIEEQKTKLVEFHKQKSLLRKLWTVISGS